VTGADVAANAPQIPDRHEHTSRTRISQRRRCAPEMNQTSPTVEQGIAINPIRDSYLIVGRR
jgi:hypothetical protein